MWKNGTDMRNMKNGFVLGLAFLVVAFVSSQAGAGDLFFAGSSPGSPTTNRATVIISAAGYPARPSPTLTPGQPVVHWLSVTSDLATARCTFYTVGTPAAITAASSGTTNVVVVSAADAATFTTTNRVLILRHRAADTYERMTNIDPTGNTIKFTLATASAVAVGDQVYVATAVGYGLPVGAAGKEFSASEGIYAGVAGDPLMIEVTGTAQCNIFGYCGKFRIE